MKQGTLITCLIFLAGPVQAGPWTCSVPYDEVNGGGTVSVHEDRIIFQSNWPHRTQDIARCIKVGLESECMNAGLSENRNGGASVFTKLYSIVWAPDGRPKDMTTRQVSAIFKDVSKGYTLSKAFPAIAYTVPLIDCVSH